MRRGRARHQNARCGVGRSAAGVVCRQVPGFLPAVPYRACVRHLVGFEPRVRAVAAGLGACRVPAHVAGGAVLVQALVLGHLSFGLLLRPGGQAARQARFRRAAAGKLRHLRSSEGCRTCSTVCPENIDVALVDGLVLDSCTFCLDCLENCPTRSISLSLGTRKPEPPFPFRTPPEPTSPLRPTSLPPLASGSLEDCDDDLAVR